MKSCLVGMIALASLLILGDFTGSSSALAMGRGSNPCEPAMDNLCGGLLQQGHALLAACLQEHWNELPDACKAVMTPKGSDAK